MAKSKNIKPGDRPDVFMPLYIGDYLAGTSRLTTELHGAYLLLIMDYWMNGPPPDDDQILASITKLSFDAWSIARAKLEHFFIVAQGCWMHKRIDEELANASHRKQKSVERAEKAAAARWGNATSNASSIPQEVLEECPSPSPSPSIDKTNTSDEVLVMPAPKKPKRATQKNLNGHLPDDQLDFSSWPNLPSEEVWTDYKKMRTDKKAWITQAVIDYLGNVLTACARIGYPVDRVLTLAKLRGWQGLEVQWVIKNYGGNITGGNYAVSQNIHRKSGVGGGLAHDDTTWAEELFGGEQDQGGRPDQQGVQVIEGDFSRVVGGD